MSETIEWKERITPSSNLFFINFKEIWSYRDLLILWVKRDISSIYKQTILGPLWFFLQPILTTLTYIIIFKKVGNFSTQGIPPILFYLSGIILWGYFAECVTKTASFLKDNNQIFSKVYFPRLIIPLSITITTLIKFAIQFCLFLLVYAFFLFTNKNVEPTIYIFLFPVILLFVALLGLGTGLIVASLTIRYKDLSHLITFAIQLLMFISTVFFPLNSIAEGAYKKIIIANPMSGLIEAYRFIFTGTGQFYWSILLYDSCLTALILATGIILFNYTEKSFVDTI